MFYAVSSGFPSYEPTEDRRIIYFVNRYMKYRLIGTSDKVAVKADIYDYETAIRQILS